MVLMNDVLTESISNVVDSADTSVGITEAIGANLHTGTALFFAESATGSVVLIVAKGVVAMTLEAKR